MNGACGTGALPSVTVPSTSATGGNASTDEDDIAYAPPELLEEEEKLRKQREQDNRRALKAVFAPDTDLAKLDTLLERAEMFTKLLSENMRDIEKGTEREAAEAARAAQAAAKEERRIKGGVKRGAGPAAKRKGAKRAKPSTADEEDAPLTPTQELLPLVRGELRDYQLKGVKWIISLWQNGINGILADQMGLGKTVQTIGFLAHLLARGIRGPFLVIGPLSTLANWVAEFERWCPSLAPLLYHGTRAERAALRETRLKLGRDGAVGKDFPVVITSYEIVLADSAHLSRLDWKFLIVDEGHRLKNFDCKLLRELRTFRAGNKLLLSGTPLQNNLGELWSLLNFLMPDIFMDQQRFQAWFDFDGLGNAAGAQEILAQETKNRVVSKLHSILRPFLLRRIKSDVEASLPAKLELVLYAGMSGMQKEINAQLAARTLDDAATKVANGEGGKQISRLNNVLMQMRKNCNHPDLIAGPLDGSITFPPADELVAQCGKLALLERILTRLRAGGHKVLIFSQMTRMLDLLDTFLDERGLPSVRIDGAVPWQERQEAVKAYNSDPALFAFLLSTRAGGLGINLTAADTVIIYDSDWNPHQDMQAMDRCHRIGQTRAVLVLRLATARSVEGRLLRRAASKLALERLVIKKGAFLQTAAQQADAKGTSMSAEELVAILKGDAAFQDKPQSGTVSDQVLEQLLDRSHLEKGLPAPYPASDVGYEVVSHLEGQGLLSGVE